MVHHDGHPRGIPGALLITMLALAGAGCEGSDAGPGAQDTEPAFAGASSDDPIGGTGGTDGLAGAGGGEATPTDAGDIRELLDAGATAPVPSSGCGASEWPASGEHSLDVNGTERTFIVRIPASYDPGKPYRLVLAWHGFTMRASQVAGPSGLGGVGQFFGLEPLADDSAIFVAGQGLDTMLLGMTAPGWDNKDGRDVAFARALVDFLRVSYCIDDARIFSTGASMGGYMSNQLGCELSDTLRAVASMIGGGPLPLGGVQCVDPMPAWITHGTMDTVNPYRQSEASRDHWARVNHCSAQTTEVGPARCVAYDGCDPGYPVHFCPFEGGHVLPGFAAEGMWAFFAQF